MKGWGSVRTECFTGIFSICDNIIGESPEDKQEYMFNGYCEDTLGSSSSDDSCLADRPKLTRKKTVSFNEKLEIFVLDGSGCKVQVLTSPWPFRDSL